MARLGKQGKITPVFQARGKTKRQKPKRQKTRQKNKDKKMQRDKTLGVRQRDKKNILAFPSSAWTFSKASGMSRLYRKMF